MDIQRKERGEGEEREEKEKEMGAAARNWGEEWLERGSTNNVAYILPVSQNLLKQCRAKHSDKHQRLLVGTHYIKPPRAPTRTKCAGRWMDNCIINAASCDGRRQQLAPVPRCPAPSLGLRQGRLQGGAQRRPEKSARISERFTSTPISILDHDASMTATTTTTPLAARARSRPAARRRQAQLLSRIFSCTLCDLDRARRRPWISLVTMSMWASQMRTLA